MALPNKVVFTDTKEDVATTDHVDDATPNLQVIEHNHPFVTPSFEYTKYLLDFREINQSWNVWILE